jgi:hypothetical protein
MTQPTLTILGVYKPQISKEVWQEQWQVTCDDNQTREHFDKLVLIEAVVEGLDEPFDMGSFGQIAYRIPRRSQPHDGGLRRSSTFRRWRVAS